MHEVTVFATAASTIFVVWLVSALVNDLDSLPVDFFVAGVSLVILFVDVADRTVGNGSQNIGTNPIWVMAFVCFITVVFAILVIFVFNSAKKDIPDAVKEQMKINLHLFREGGYWVSLILSMLYLIFSLSIAYNAEDMISIDLKERGGVGRFFDYLTSQATPLVYGFVAAIFILTIAKRNFAPKILVMIGLNRKNKD